MKFSTIYAAKSKEARAISQFKKVLIKQGALNRNTGSLIVKGITGEDALYTEWKSCARGFIHKGKHVIVDMHVERLMHNESICRPIIYWR